MIELARHIEILLLDNDCVIVPGLGGFVSHYIPAHWVESEQRFLPPYRTLGFNPKMMLNDGLLVQSYMQAYDATYPEAFRLVEQKVQQVKLTLEQEGTFALHGIGTLQQDMTGAYTFTPIEAGLLSPALYGLSALEIQTLDELEKVAAQPAVVQPQPTLTATLDATEAMYQQRSSRLERMWLTGISAACVALLITLFLTVPHPSGQGKLANLKPLVEWWNKAVKQETLPIETVQPEVRKQTAQTTSQHSKAKPAAEAEAPETADTKAEAVAETAAENPAQPAVVQSETPSHYYTIVLACSYSPRNAAIFAEQLAEKGYTDNRLLTKGQMTRVVYAQFDTETEAANQLRSLRAKDKLFADGWIYEVK